MSSPGAVLAQVTGEAGLTADQPLHNTQGVSPDIQFHCSVLEHSLRWFRYCFSSSPGIRSYSLVCDCIGNTQGPYWGCKNVHLRPNFGSLKLKRLDELSFDLKN